MRSLALILVLCLFAVCLLPILNVPAETGPESNAVETIEPVDIIMYDGLMLETAKPSPEQIQRMRTLWGTYEEGKNYNQIIDGHGTGLRPPTNEELGNVKMIKTMAGTMALNTTVDHSTSIHFPPVGSQDGEGSCVCWCVGYFIPRPSRRPATATGTCPAANDPADTRANPIPHTMTRSYHRTSSITR